MIFDTIIQGLVFYPLVLGLFLSFRILGITDLTVDGSFVLGASLFGSAMRLGADPYTACIFAALGGAICGALVSIAHRHIQASPLIIGILFSSMLCSINLAILGQPNLGLLGYATVFAPSKPAFLILNAIILAFAILRLIRSPLGTKMRAFGCNPKLLPAFHHKPHHIRSLGLSLANGLAAYSGALMSQHVGFVDIYMGLGMSLVAITTILLTATFARSLFVEAPLLILGCATYFLLLNGVQLCGINPAHLQFVVGITLLLVLKCTRTSTALLRSPS